jgi:hypothetical protein
MVLSFDATVAALTASIIRERCGAAGDGSGQQHVVRFLLDTHARMPDYLRLPFRGLTLAFDAAALPFAGRPFHRLPHERRWRQIRAWRTSTLGVRRDLVKFYETLAVFGWYSERYGRDYVSAHARHDHGDGQ